MNFNLVQPLRFFFGGGIYHHVANLTVVIMALAILHLVGLKIWPVSFLLWVSLIVFASIAIWRAGDFFQPAADYVQEKHKLPESIKAAVIDAVASSFPEFCVAVIAVILLGRAEVGISSIVGSALYNVLIIPAAAGLVAKGPMKIGKEVVWRDSLMYFGVVILLLVALLAFPNAWGFGVAALFILAYVGYIFWLNIDYRKHKRNLAEEDNNESVPTETEASVEEEEESELEIRDEPHAWKWILGMMLVMGLASHILVEASIQLGDLLGIDAVIMGFIVIAAGTSVPDTVLSVLSAKRGNYDAAISNVFGSNIFDICICLSVPILLALVLTGSVTPVNLPQIELVYMLVGATALAIYLFWSDNYTLTKTKSTIMFGIYLLIILVAMAL
ncbi:MAG TPA: sodium:proton exchanger [Deltaproteobacteria bacterium]|nr:sodium:calcium antiporter [Pseudomonadota bacterium]RZO45864.1 MAG: sodium:calcium antiporter [Pseudomonadota bacterium]HBM52329.1 sodium:proton exchanger [Deltaproteobacteria bacterium]|tara:strand:- start:404 stop:1564 length:1161 start_codon:yes stop_codon:yes gene_type:complete